MRFADIDALQPIFTPSSATTPNRAIPNFAHKIRTCSNTDSIAAAVSAYIVRFTGPDSNELQAESPWLVPW